MKPAKNGNGEISSEGKTPIAPQNSCYLQNRDKEQTSEGLQEAVILLMIGITKTEA